ncbi:MAG: hypothetical protein Q9216_002480 [Gyalolechia sp. 2 TL-2023]
MIDAPANIIVPSLNFTSDPNTYCTTNPTWKDPSFADLRNYVHGCKDAARLARNDLWFDGHYELEEEYELLSFGTDPQTTKPQIRLPKIYTSREHSTALSFSYDNT